MTNTKPVDNAVGHTELPLRIISHEEAREIVGRLIAGSFRRDGEYLEHDKRPRFSIPTQPARDDDCLICDYIEQQKVAHFNERPALLARLVEMEKALEEVCAADDQISATMGDRDKNDEAINRFIKAKHSARGALATQSGGVE